jgi:plastocyanin
MKGTQQTLSVTIILFLSCALCSCTTPDERANHTQEPAVARSHIVVIQQMKFTPAEVIVKEGDSVTWINKDILDHNVTEENHNLWTSGTVQPGKSWSMVVKQSADYFCTLHPVMKGGLIVR